MRIANPCQVCGTGRELVYRTVKTAMFKHAYWKCDNCQSNGKTVTYREKFLTGNKFIETSTSNAKIKS